MNYKTHVNGGILAGLYVTCQIPKQFLLANGLLVSGCIIGSLFPDIDHKKSYIGQKVKKVSKAINKIAGHRKLFHAPLLYLLLYSMCIGVVSDNVILFFINGLFLGILSHLILDSFTVGGLPWFYPFNKNKVCLGKVKTNSKLEDALCGILSCMNVVIILDIIHIT